MFSLLLKRKKIERLMGLFAVIVCIFMMSPSTSFATENDLSNFSVEFYREVQGGEEWKSTNDHALKLKLCQIPEEVLKNLDTESLIDAILSFPFYMDIYAFDSISDGMRVLRENFNGLRELSQRPDAAQLLLDRYQAMQPITDNLAQFVDSEDTSVQVFELSNMEALLAQDFVIEGLNSEEIEVLNSAVLEKYKQKNTSYAYGITERTFYDVFNETCDESSIRSKFDLAPLESTSYVYTPNGTSVLVYINGEELSASEKIEMNNYMAKLYPSATRLGTATTNYNCHSYAWYSQSTSNTRWMDNPSAYWTDGSYTNLSNPAVSNKMIYVTNGYVTHSGVVSTRLQGPVSPSYGYTDLVNVKSKWGAYGLYEHNGLSSPYWVSNTYTTFYKR